MGRQANVEKSSRGARSQPSSSPSTSPSSPWILGPWVDVGLIVASPIAVILLLTFARQVWSGAAVSAFVMVWAIGHHLPGMMRAYGDPALFRRFRVRFIVAPLLLLSACSFAFVTGVNSGLISLAAVWGWWHYLMQAYGFCRIYDSKVGSFATTTRWLDQAMCLTWFAAAVVLNDNTLYGFVENFYNSGLPIPSEQFFDTLRSVTRGATVGITLLFVINLVRRWQQGDRPSPIKLAVMFSTFACFWYSAATVTNIVVAYAFFELFHDVQYLTIVWAFNRRRVEKDSHLQGFTRWLFQPRVALVLVYLVLIAGYGSLKWGSTYVSDAMLQKVLAAVFLTSTLLHYYFDGFIWKLREAETRDSFDVTASAPAWHARIPMLLRHGLLWGLFVIPFVGLAVSQVQDAIWRHELDDATKTQLRLEESEQLVRIAPNSFRAYYTLGLANEMAGDLQRAESAYSESLQRCPGYTPAEDRLRGVRGRQQANVSEAS